MAQEDYIIEVNGKRYQHKTLKDPKKLSKSVQKLLTIGALYVGGLDPNLYAPVVSYCPLDVIQEFRLIQDKKSKFPRAQRDYFVKRFNKHFTEI